MRPEVTASGCIKSRVGWTYRCNFWREGWHNVAKLLIFLNALKFSLDWEGVNFNYFDISVLQISSFWLTSWRKVLFRCDFCYLSFKASHCLEYCSWHQWKGTQIVEVLHGQSKSAFNHCNADWLMNFVLNKFVFVFQEQETRLWLVRQTLWAFRLEILYW